MNSAEKARWYVFWALVALVAAVLVAVVVPAAGHIIMGSPFAIVIIALVTGLGITLIVLAARIDQGLTRVFFIVTGAAAAGIPVSILLHNAIYGLAIHFFGSNFWQGGDEAFFFIIALIICPVAFVAGAAGSIILAQRRRVPAR